MDDPKGGVRGVVLRKAKYTDEDAKRRDGSFNTQEIIEVSKKGYLKEDENLMALGCSPLADIMLLIFLMM